MRLPMASEEPVQKAEESEDQLSAATPQAISTSTRSLISFYLIVGIVVVLWKENWRALAFMYWWASLAIVLVVLALLFLPYTRKWLEGAGTSDRTALLVFGVVPVLVALGLVVAKFPQYQFYALRLPYLVLVLLLPGVMFYLFIVNRKTSLLNEFVANLDRLGVLAVQKSGQQSLHSEAQSIAVLSGRRRLMSYLRQFEAIYGVYLRRCSSRPCRELVPEALPRAPPSAWRR
jgi:hypothetical protein